MKVRMKADVSGTRNGREWPRRGGTVDLPDTEAAHLCAAGMAEPVADSATVETAVAPPAEKRTPAKATRAKPLDTQE